MNDKIETITAPGGGGSFSLDSRYLPLIICTWTGAPTLEIMNFFFERRKAHFDRALAAGTKIIQISDLSNMATPPATTRQYIGEQGKILDVHDGFLSYVVVVPNAVIRGVITAMKWIAGDDVKPVEFSPSIEDAFKRAAKAFESAGIPFTTTVYTPPQK